MHTALRGQVEAVGRVQARMPGSRAVAEHLVLPIDIDRLGVSPVEVGCVPGHVGPCAKVTSGIDTHLTVDTVAQDGLAAGHIGVVCIERHLTCAPLVRAVAPPDGEICLLSRAECCEVRDIEVKVIAYQPGLRADVCRAGRVVHKDERIGECHVFERQLGRDIQCRCCTGVDFDAVVFQMHHAFEIKSFAQIDWLLESYATIAQFFQA